MSLAIFGIDNSGLSLGITFAILALVAIWIALVVFTFSDAKRRISDPFLIGCATAASLFPFVGTVVYTILRPPEYLDDIRERETEMKAAETRVRHLNANSCRKCGFPAEPDFIRCPACRTRLREPCPSCSRPVGLKWRVCAYCEHTLIESKRPSSSGRTTSRSTSKSAPSERGSGSSASPKTVRPTRKAPTAKVASKEPTAAKPRRRSSSPETDANAEAPVRKQRAPRAGKPGESTGRETSSGRQRLVVSDEDLSGETINGGQSEPTGKTEDA